MCWGPGPISFPPWHDTAACSVSWNGRTRILTPHDHYVKRFVDAPLAHPTVLFRRNWWTGMAHDTGPPLPGPRTVAALDGCGVRFAKLPEELLTWHDHAGRSAARIRTTARTPSSPPRPVVGQWLKRTLNGRPVIVAGTSTLCRDRAAKLEAGIPSAPSPM